MSHSISLGRQLFFSVFLLPFFLMFLTSCSQQDGDNLVSNVAPNSKITEDSKVSNSSSSFLDCSGAITVSVSIDAGRAYTPDQSIALLVDQPVRIVVQSDVAVVIDLRGSESYNVIQAESGLNSVCTSYRESGQYPVQIDEFIPLVFVVE